MLPSPRKKKNPIGSGRELLGESGREMFCDGGETGGEGKEGERMMGGEMGEDGF